METGSSISKMIMGKREPKWSMSHLKKSLEYESREDRSCWEYQGIVKKSFHAESLVPVDSHHEVPSYKN